MITCEVMNLIFVQYVLIFLSWHSIDELAECVTSLIYIFNIKLITVARLWQSAVHMSAALKY